MMCDKQGWCSGESARLPPMCPGFDFRTQRHMWVELLVGSQFFTPRGFSPGSPVFPSPQKHFQIPIRSGLLSSTSYHEPLARVIAQALPVFDIKFAFTFTFSIINVAILLVGNTRAICTAFLAKQKVQNINVIRPAPGSFGPHSIIWERLCLKRQS